MLDVRVLRNAGPVLMICAMTPAESMAANGASKDQSTIETVRWTHQQDDLPSTPKMERSPLDVVRLLQAVRSKALQSPMAEPVPVPVIDSLRPSESLPALPAEKFLP